MQLIENNHQRPQLIASFCRLFLDYTASQPTDSPVKKGKMEAGELQGVLYAPCPERSRGEPPTRLSFFRGSIVSAGSHVGALRTTSDVPPSTRGEPDGERRSSSIPGLGCERARAVRDLR
jgi:hypothetical protein